jgi:hypothetical protein
MVENLRKQILGVGFTEIHGKFLSKCLELKISQFVRHIETKQQLATKRRKNEALSMIKTHAFEVYRN